LGIIEKLEKEHLKIDAVPLSPSFPSSFKMISLSESIRQYPGMDTILLLEAIVPIVWVMV
jgi:hypothetical protein